MFMQVTDGMLGCSQAGVAGFGPALFGTVRQVAVRQGRHGWRLPVAFEFLSPPEVSVKYGVPIRTIQTACASGRIRAEKVGRFYLIHPEEAEKFAARHKSRHNGHTLP